VKSADGVSAYTLVKAHSPIKDTQTNDKQPTAQELEEMNHAAHEQCFIANSVKTEVTVETQK
jgi:organic hydroperoxide reductase OsmC/OhrA